VDAGCTADSLAATASQTAPSDTLPPLPSTSATPSPTEDPPGATGYPLPEEARAYTPEGARAFFDYFIAVLNASSAVNDPIPLRELGQGCEFCDELTQRYEQNAVDGLRVVGADLVLTGVGEVVVGPTTAGADGAGMAFTANQTASQVFDAAGALILDTPPIELVGSVGLVWLSDQRDWLVNELGLDMRT